MSLGEYWNTESLEINKVFEKQIRDNKVSDYNNENANEFSKWYSDKQYCFLSNPEGKHIILNGFLVKLTTEKSNVELQFRYAVMSFGEFQGITEVKKLFINDPDSDNAVTELGSFEANDYWRNWGNGDFCLVSITRKID